MKKQEKNETKSWVQSALVLLESIREMHKFNTDINKDAKQERDRRTFIATMSFTTLSFSFSLSTGMRWFACQLRLMIHSLNGSKKQK